MKPWLHAPAGLVGRIFAILLLALTLEFGVSTLLYERASHFSLQDDEARRLAEHLVIARKLVEERPAIERPAMAHELTTNRYEIRWAPHLLPPPRLAPSLDRMYHQIVGWEPGLADADLRLNLASPGRDAVTTGGLRLSDGSWLYFTTQESVHQPNLVIERVLLAMIPAAALILIGGLMVRQTLLPLRRLAQATDNVGSGSEEEVPEGGSSEVRRVIRAFNRMRARIHRLIADRTQALAAVGHDLRTPLARLRLRADGIPDDALRDAVEADVAEMEAMIASLLAYLGGESESEKLVVIDLAVLCASLCDEIADRGRDGNYRGPAHLEMAVRPSAMKRALVNLVENALHHGDTVTITLTRHADQVRIAVEDDGPGIPEDQLAQVLEPFVRLDTARSRDTIGLGLGLAIVVRAVAEHRGTLTLTNRAEGGLRAEICLPVPPSNLS
ncbi:ATP-binding protein [Sphingomonas sp. CJ20]